MKFHLKKPPKLGDTRTQHVFALFPRWLYDDDGRLVIVWLERFERVQKYQKFQRQVYDDDETAWKWESVIDWLTISRKPIYKSEQPPAPNLSAS